MEKRSTGELTIVYLRGRIARHEITVMTGRNHRCYLRTFAEVVGDRPANRLSTADIERWLETRAHLRPATRRTQLSVVQGFCRWLVDTKELRSNPCDKVKAVRLPRHVPRALPEQSVTDTLAACPDARAEVIVWLMVGLGLRCCEVANMEVGDWDRRGHTVRVVGKGGHERELPTTEEVERAILRYLGEWPASSGPLIRSYRSPAAPLQADTLSGMVSELMRAAGVKRVSRDGVSAHALRHTCASDVIERCGDLRVVQALLGHQHLSSTSVYLRRAQLGKMREAMAGRTYRGA